MKNSKYALTILMVSIALTSCEQWHGMDDECNNGDYYCVNDNYYTCSEGKLNSKTCVNGCANTGKCQCAESCVNGCDETGKCQCAEGCVNGCDETGKCHCSAKCPEVCTSTGQCICENGETVCANKTEIKECYDHIWQTSTCPAGCQKGDENSKDACIPFVCADDDIQCAEDGSKTQKCVQNAWTDGDECPVGCNKGVCLNVEDLVISSDRVRLLNVENLDSAQIDVQYIVNNTITSTKFDVLSSNSECVVTNQETLEDNTTRLTIKTNPEVIKCTTTISVKTGDLEKTIEVRVFGADEDENGNHMLDYYETAEKQGKDCWKYSDCDSLDGTEKGFCDSFIDYKCSTKCTDNSQCANPEESQYHFVCRKDGRCAPDALEFVVQLYESSSSTTYSPIEFNPSLLTDCDFTIDWGDGNQNEVKCPSNEQISHLYLKGTQGDLRTIKIKGVIEGVAFGETNSIVNVPVVLIHAFGPAGLYVEAFRKYRVANVNLFEELVDIPDATSLKSMAQMFAYSRTFNEPIGNWDTSNVTDMNGAFKQALAFDQDISHWDTSKVENMTGMFFVESMSGYIPENVFNQNLSHWNTSNVTNMSYMVTAQPGGNPKSFWRCRKNCSFFLKSGKY